jgi:pimeloyl-ACP methyl ester carboxylesterase
VPFVQVGDLLIQYQLADYTEPWRREPGETFLLYHGYARNMSFWTTWVPLLGRDYRVLRFDARGCGETTKPPPGTSFTLDQLVGDAIGLMDQLGIERVHWVGESSGGVVGVGVALSHPDRLASLTLCNTPFKRPDAVSRTYTVGEADQATAIEKYGVGGWCRRTLPYRLDLTRAPAGMGDWYVDEMDRTPKHVAIEMHKLIGTVDFWPRLAQIRVPTLILVGDNSAISRQDEMERVREQLPGARVVVFDGYGHGINLLAPERCVEEIRAFLGQPAHGRAGPALPVSLGEP